jgi:hypothetical protein
MDMNFKMTTFLREHKEELINNYLEINSIAKAVRKLCNDNDIDYTESFRAAASKIINNEDLPSVENITTTETKQYKSDNPVSILSALKQDGTIMDIEEYCASYNIPFEQVKTYKLVTHTGKGAYYNIASADVRNTESLDSFKEQLISAIKDIPNRPKSVVRVKDTNSDGHLLVVDPADVHIQKLATVFETGDEYNSQIACQRVREGVEGLIQKAKGFNIDKILFVGGNDILHTDNAKKTTTSGTFQDVDSNWYTAFAVAKGLYIEVIDRLLEVADVHFVHNPSNHDWMLGTLLADVIQTYYKDCSNITFDCDLRHRKYFKYGRNLIGTTHGDGAKNDILPILMATEEPIMWSETKFRYYFTHHVHHKVSKDYIGVTVEALRSPSGTDGWHSKSGYCNVLKAVEGFIHHPEYGQIARLTHLF